MGGYPQTPLPPTAEMQKETVHVYIPNSSVGAIIGTGGSTIRDMINASGASIKVGILSINAYLTNTLQCSFLCGMLSVNCLCVRFYFPHRILFLYHNFYEIVNIFL